MQCIYRTNDDIEHRWKMLSDTKLRTKALALSLYAMPFPNRTGGLAVADMKETSSRTASSYDHDQIKPRLVKMNQSCSNLLNQIMQPKAIHNLVHVKMCKSSGPSLLNPIHLLHATTSSNLFMPARMVEEGNRSHCQMAVANDDGRTWILS
ncbi:hypothetical protein Ddye_025561 [Dipteronia dyeriana]|uniref:Uncharacterized protein n=1 Tax=Dipteronia dyeriana TaxID=168575 RepID=A0AAD9TKL6_9ROSI|nr:hypothetical protein Ddye_025561 [Dipteronia dyeriana]